MKKLFYSFLGLIAVATAVSCDELQELISAKITIPKAMESIFSDGLNLDYVEGTAQVQFFATQAWSTTIEEVEESVKGVSWLSIDPAQGEAGSVTMKVTVIANDTEELRKAKVTITCGEVQMAFKVFQSGKEPEENIPAESITLEPSTAVMKVGETLQFVAKVMPENSTDKVEWASGNEEILKVEDGLVTALKEGTTTIVATAGKARAVCRIDVTQGSDEKIEVTSIKLNKEEITLAPGQSEQLEVVELLPENATDKTVVWESSNPEVAVVVERDETYEGVFYKGGLVTGFNPGEAIITAYAGVTTAQCKVIVKSGGGSTIESLKIDPSATTIAIDEEAILTAIVTPSDAKVDIEWKSDNPDVVAVGKISDTQAKIQGMYPGTTKVMAFADGLMAYCEVTVKKGGGSVVEVESITLDKTDLTMSVNETAQLMATVLPENATDKTVTWSSSNDRVVSVYDGGIIYAASEGQAVVTAKAGNVTASCNVTVKRGGSDLESVSINPSSVSIARDEEVTVELVLVPSDAEVSIFWESESPITATVSMKSKLQAVIKGISAGQTNVIAYVGNQRATCQVTVTDSDEGIPVTSITLNKTELNLQVNEQFQLIATVLPEDATNKELIWTSTMPSSKVYISISGMVSALAEAEGTITVTSISNPTVKATCHVKVSGQQAGEEAVDLGLPSGLKWRSMNVGASKPEDYGDHFAWGETSKKSSYSWSNYKFGDNKMGPFSKYDTDGKTVLEAEDDAAIVNLGNDWRMPTFAEWKELREKCSWKWTTRGGVGGMQVTGPNGKSIFLPAAGYYNSGLTMQGSYGSYWTSSDAGIVGMAHAVDFISSGVDKAALYRCQGNSVRPVKD